jgi:pectin methylesterase-like acyl-CoA thioesterase
MLHRVEGRRSAVGRGAARPPAPRAGAILWPAAAAAFAASLALTSARAQVVGLVPASGTPAACADAPLSITFAQPPAVGASGTIRVFRADDGTLADSITLGDPNSAKKPIGGAVSDNGTLHLFNYYPALVRGNTALISLHRPLAYGQTYYVTIDPGVLTDGQGFVGIADPNTWRFTTRAAPRIGAAAPGQITVAQDGTGDFCSVQGAIDAVPANSAHPVLIDVGKGVYDEIVYVVPSKPLITVRGEDRDRTVIEYANNDAFNVAPVSNANNQCIQRRIPGTPDLYNCWRALFGVEASDFTLENITLHNTTPYGGTQAEAFRGNNDRILLNRVNLLSFQDTLRLQTSGFVTNSYIEGDVDFTWGTGAAFFWESELKSMHAGYVSQVRNDGATHGFVYVGDRLIRAPGVPDASVYLSRIEPLRFPYSEAVFIGTAMDRHILPVGWQLNPATVTCAQAPNVHFWEYRSTDLSSAPIDVSQRLPCSAQISDTLAAQYSDPAYILNGWVPSTINATPAAYPGPAPGPVAPGSTVVVNWSTPPGHAAQDVVGLFRAGDPTATPISVQLAGSGATTGVLSFALPSAPGRYQFGYYASDSGRGSGGGRTLRATSNVVVAARPCDIDGNGQVDSQDIGAVLAARGQTAPPGDLRDADGDGTVTVLDARLCVQRCAHANCAP